MRIKSIYYLFLKKIFFSYKMKMTFLLIALIAFTACDNSGVKIGITSNFFKVLTKFDLNSVLQNKTLIEREEASGKYLFNYDVVCENLFFTNIVNPDNVIIEQETTTDGLPQVRVQLTNIKAAIQIEYLYVKYGLIKETFDNPTGSVVVSLLEGRYHFTNDGKLVLSDFNVEIEDLEIDVKKDFLNWLIGLFKGLITSQVSKRLDELGGTIADGVNKWVDNEFNVDIGYGISLNLTNTLKPKLTQVMKNQKLNEYGLKAAKFLFPKDILSETLTSVLTFGVHGSCYPEGHPELLPYIPPAAPMDFNLDYLTNEIQVLISSYSFNTIFAILQHIGLSHYEFTNASHPIFGFNFDTVGMQTLIPQYGVKYPDAVYEVQMNFYIDSRHTAPYIEMTEKGGKLTGNFNLDFFTRSGEEPVEDLSIDVNIELPFTIKVKYDLMTITWGALNVTNLEEIKNLLNIPHEELVALIKTMFDSYITKFIKGYTKNVALASILSLITGMEFKNFKLETKEGFLLISIAVNLDK